MKTAVAYTLNDLCVDRDNILELVILLGKYDVYLKEYMTDCIAKSKKFRP